jgi:hypothetical protein
MLADRQASDLVGAITLTWSESELYSELATVS